MFPQYSVSATDTPLTENQLNTPLFKGMVRVTLASALPDCLNQKILTQLAPYYRARDQNLASIADGLKEIGMWQVQGRFIDLLNTIQYILSLSAFDINVQPNKNISCDAKIPQTVQVAITTQINQISDLKVVLVNLEKQVKDIASTKKEATPAQKILIVRNSFKVLKQVIYIDRPRFSRNV